MVVVASIHKTFCCFIVVYESWRRVVLFEEEGGFFV